MLLSNITLANAEDLIAFITKSIFVIDETNVRIPNRVTNIGFDAFASCQGLVNVTIGNSVVNIGISAFKGCVSLASVSIPASVEYIGYGAFSGMVTLCRADAGIGHQSDSHFPL